jgi:thiamine-monophosphate kinase
MGEFDLIRRFFTWPTPRAVVGVGDDCALLAPNIGTHLAISTDTLISGRHFFADVDPYALGHKALAVNLSDLAACGARPSAFVLALTLPEVNTAWLEAFAKGLFDLAQTHGCELIGGDTTRGPLTITITVFGEVPNTPTGGVTHGIATGALLRSGALVGDDIYVSGSVGDAALALRALQGKITLPVSVMAAARARLERPEPRVALGMALREVASACADVSDGLRGDLGHILERSQLGAALQWDALMPLLATRQNYPGGALAFDASFGSDFAAQCVLGGGDDYELVFTAAQTKRMAVTHAAKQSATPVTRIGTVVSGHVIALINTNGKTLPPLDAGDFAAFDHFSLG